MCIVCVEWNRGKLTNKEARGALRELVLTDSIQDVEHVEELLEDIEAAEEDETPSS